MTCVIIEDQLPAQRVLKKYIADMGTLSLVGAYTDALEAMPILKAEPVDLMFLDIHLPKVSGIDFLKSLTKSPQVILTTAFPDYALESYELNVVDYLLKPFSFQRFLKAVSKVSVSKDLQQQPSSQDAAISYPEEVYIKSGYDHIRVAIADILFIKSDADYTEIHLNNKKHLSPEPLRYWEEILPSQTYVRLHKSYIVNTSRIDKISGNLVYLEFNQKVPIGRAYKQEFTERFIK